MPRRRMSPEQARACVIGAQGPIPTPTARADRHPSRDIGDLRDVMAALSIIWMFSACLSWHDILPTAASPLQCRTTNHRRSGLLWRTYLRRLPVTHGAGVKTVRSCPLPGHRNFRSLRQVGRVADGVQKPGGHRLSPGLLIPPVTPVPCGGPCMRRDHFPGLRSPKSGSPAYKVPGLIQSQGPVETGGRRLPPARGNASHRGLYRPLCARHDNFPARIGHDFGHRVRKVPGSAQSQASSNWPAPRTRGHHPPRSAESETRAGVSSGRGLRRGLRRHGGARRPPRRPRRPGPAPW